MPTTLKLDFDNGAELDELRLSFLISTLEDSLTERHRYQTKRGHHIVLKLEKSYEPVAVVALQAILGSDPNREIFNICRALQLEHAPQFWRQLGRWNTLYVRKLSTEPVSMTIDTQKFSRGKPAVTVEHLGDSEAAVWNIHSVEEISLTQDGETRPRLILNLEQFPDNGYWLNVTGIKTLVAEYGTDETKWVGKPVPFVRSNTKNPQTGADVEVLWVAPADQWEEIFSQAGIKRGTRRIAGAAKKAPAANNGAAKKTAGRKRS